MNEKRMIAKVMKNGILEVMPEAKKAYYNESCFTLVISGDENNLKLRIENGEYEGKNGEIIFIIYPDSSLAEFDIDLAVCNEIMTELGFWLASITLEA